MFFMIRQFGKGPFLVNVINPGEITEAQQHKIKHPLYNSAKKKKKNHCIKAKMDMDH